MQELWCAHRQWRAWYPLSHRNDKTTDHIWVVLKINNNWRAMSIIGYISIICYYYYEMKRHHKIWPCGKCCYPLHSVMSLSVCWTPCGSTCWQMWLSTSLHYLTECLLDTTRFNLVASVIIHFTLVSQCLLDTLALVTPHATQTGLLCFTCLTDPCTSHNNSGCQDTSGHSLLY